MKNRKWLWAALPLLGIFVTGIIAYSTHSGVVAQPAAGNGAKGKILDTLPIKQVVLFNSGVGYFQREGEVEGNVHIPLSFPVGDINDLLKSLVLQDSKGRVGTVNYDSSDPIDKILRSFALDLTANPTFGQILNQARGEKIEITWQPTATAQPLTLTGTIVGMESAPRPAGKDNLVEVQHLNLLCAEGMRNISLADLQ